MRGLRPLLVLLAVLVLSLRVEATHNRAGEIIVCQVSGFTYQATIITHTKLSAPADRPELVLDWGDGSPLDTIARTTIENFPDQDLRRNTYVATHLYAGPGVFTLQFDDQNRNGGVINVPNSIAQSFCVKTQLVVSPITGGNCSARFLNSPIQNACINQPWVHNPVAIDLDGDSLSYEPVVCLGLNCAPISGYSFPGPNYSIDPTSGTITWNAPTVAGEYNIAFIVREWRRVNGEWRNVGWVTRDMQVTVVPCSNIPPVITDVPDTCVTAGTFLSFAVQASDPNFGQQVILNALGQPFEVPSSPAVFNTPPPAQSVTGTFNWSTNCSHVRLQPYQVVFSARDNDEVQLYDYSTMLITVVAPAPVDPSATPVGNTIELSWSPSPCTNATGYLIYRRSGLYGFTPDNCETGVPAYTGYSLIGSTTGVSSTSFVDNGDLVIGNQYCYMVVATFADGAQSYASVEFCTILDRQVPVMTHVSVGATDVAAGIDTVRWSNAFALDTVARPGPYQFRLYRGTGLNTANNLIWTSPLHPFLDHPDTSFLDNGLNTVLQPHVYRVELWGNNGADLVGSSSPASSVFISTVPNDEQLTVQWSLNTPWTNSLYEVYRDVGGTWTLIGTSTTGSYTDTGLENGATYCYLVKSIGAYSDPDITAPLINFSQEVCGSPVDLTPPCVPTATIDNSCDIPLNTLTWTNPANACGDQDTWYYNVYFTDPLGGSYRLIGTNIPVEDTVFTHADGLSVAGCYVVTAVDSVGNESAFSEPVCGDNACAGYELPNVFTPNRDGQNDLFGPFPYRGVKEIDLQVFNRWGQVVFTATDPDINWDGTHKDGGTLPDGVYYYTCRVNFIRLTGEEVRMLTGYVHILGTGVNSTVD